MDTAPYRPGKVVALFFVLEDCRVHVTWGAGQISRGNCACVELRQMPSQQNLSRYEYMAYFAAPPPAWWSTNHKAALDGEIMRHQNKLTDMELLEKK